LSTRRRTAENQTASDTGTNGFERVLTEERVLRRITSGSVVPLVPVPASLCPYPKMFMRLAAVAAAARL
jgi:hypothetical protein